MNEKIRGRRISAGFRLTKHLDDIGMEQTETILSEGDAPTFITKAEKLARNIWKMALGYTETKVVVEKGERKVKHRTVAPDHRYVALLYDRLEGKVASSDNTSGPKKQPKSSKVSEQADARVKDLAEEV